MTLRPDRVYIIHSLWKTGTTSVGRALVLLGIGDQDFGWRQQLGEDYAERMDAVNLAMAPFSFFSEVTESTKQYVLETMDGFVAETTGYTIFGDYPVAHTHLHLFAKKILFPDAKFIWLERDLLSWTDSVRRWELKHPHLYPHAEALWKNYDREFEDKRQAREFQRELVINFKKEFPDDILITSVHREWTDLCNFLHVPVPNLAFPVENVQ